MTNWNENEFYKTCKSKVTSVKTVNDVVERGVAFMDEYNKFHTTAEEQKRYFFGFSSSLNIYYSVVAVVFGTVHV